MKMLVLTLNAYLNNLQWSHFKFLSITTSEILFFSNKENEHINIDLSFPWGYPQETVKREKLKSFTSFPMAPRLNVPASVSDPDYQLCCPQAIT